MWTQLPHSGWLGDPGSQAQKQDFFHAATGAAFGAMSCHGRNMLGQTVWRFSNPKEPNMLAQHPVLQWSVIPQCWFPKTLNTQFRKAISNLSIRPCAERPLAGVAHSSYVARCRAVCGAHKMVDSRSMPIWAKATSHTCP